MNIQDIKPAEGARTATKRIGRGVGSGMGKTSTRGHKGQWARSGGGVRPNFEGGQMPMTRRLPKIGFNNKRFAHVYNQVNIDVFNRFEDGAVIDIDALKAAGLVNNTLDGVKLLAHGDVTKKFTVKVNAYSDAAKAKIEAAGGKAEVI